MESWRSAIGIVPQVSEALYAWGVNVNARCRTLFFSPEPSRRTLHMGIQKRLGTRLKRLQGLRIATLSGACQRNLRRRVSASMTVWASPVIDSLVVGRDSLSGGQRQREFMLVACTGCSLRRAC